MARLATCLQARYESNGRLVGLPRTGFLQVWVMACNQMMRLWEAYCHSWQIYELKEQAWGDEARDTSVSVGTSFLSILSYLWGSTWNTSIW